MMTGAKPMVIIPKAISSRSVKNTNGASAAASANAVIPRNQPMIHHLPRIANRTEMWRVGAFGARVEIEAMQT